MDEKIICIIPFTSEKEKWHMWLGKLITRHGIKGYDTLLTGDKKIPGDDTNKTKHRGFSELKFLNKTSYNDLILLQKIAVYFKIVEEDKKKYNMYEMKYNLG